MDIVIPAVHTRIAKYFWLDEFACKGCRFVRINFEFLNLVVLLDMLREDIKNKIIVSSGYRCPEHNIVVSGSAKDSKHLYGVAADIYSPGIGANELYRQAKKYFSNNGMGLYPNHIHVDMGPKREWTGKD